MATTPVPQLETPPTVTTVEHRPKFAKLTPEYRKAHKNYVLVAALLASWELIGINLNTKDKWGIELTSPKGIPLILFTLLAYCAYKVIIEWNLEDDPRPKSIRAQIDFWVAHVVGVGAVTIGLTQFLLKIRVADAVTGRTWLISMLIIICSALVGIGFNEVIDGLYTRRFPGIIIIAVLIAFLGAGIVLSNTSKHLGLFFVTCIIATILSLILEHRRRVRTSLTQQK